MKLNLQKEFFTDIKKDFITHGNFNIKIFRYTSGVEALEIENEKCSFIFTPFKGQQEHSKKPDIVRQKIVELIGDVSRIELFAREEYPGWMCLGNEIDGMDIREAIEKISKM